MWGSKRSSLIAAQPVDPQPPERLKEALRRVRVEEAERASVVVDLRDAEIARLEALDEALDRLFDEIPGEVDLFDRGISRGDTPRLWIDAVAHVAMGRDKRLYRFLQDTRFGRKVLAETVNVVEMVEAVTRYVAQRLLERERALASGMLPTAGNGRRAVRLARAPRRGRALGGFFLGLLVGVGLLIGAALVFGP